MCKSGLLAIVQTHNAPRNVSLRMGMGASRSVNSTRGGKILSVGAGRTFWRVLWPLRIGQAARVLGLCDAIFPLDSQICDHHRQKAAGAIRLAVSVLQAERRGTRYPPQIVFVTAASPASLSRGRFLAGSSDRPDQG